MTGKKGKKSKGVSLSLGEFLGATSTSGNASIVVKSKSNWADETDEFEEDLRPNERITLPTAPRQARGPDVDPSSIPHKPPFTAYIANLPFEVDDEEIERFFDGLQVKSVRLPREGGENGRFKGFGYVEFETRNDLVEALNKNEDQMGNRKIRVDIAEGESGNRRGGGFSDRGPREEFEDRSGGVSDWRRAPPPERSDRSPPRGGSGGGGGGGFEDRRDDRRGGGGGFGDRDRERDRGGFGDRDRGDRGGGFGDRDRDRGGGFGDRDRDRGGGFGDRDRDRGGGFGDRDRDRGGGGRYGDRDRDRDGGGGGFRDRDGGSRGGDGWRPRGGDGGDRDGPPKERPKLNLKPRTATSEDKPASSPSGGGGGAAGGGGGGIFGSAKPVDTHKKELEIESKLGTKASPAPPKRTTGGGGGGNIFGDAKPVDTASKERKIAEKLIKIEPARSSERRDDRREDRGRDDRRDDRGRDDRRDDRDDRRDDRGRDDRRDDHGRDDRRDDRGRDDRRDDRGRDDDRDDRIRDIRGGSRDIRLEQNDREPPQEDGHDDKEPPPPKMKTLKDDTPVLDTTNKFAGLGLEEEEA